MSQALETQQVLSNALVQFHTLETVVFNFFIFNNLQTSVNVSLIKLEPWSVIGRLGILYCEMNFIEKMFRYRSCVNILC